MDGLNKILLIENSDIDFYKSRFSYALFLKSKGWDVYALIPKRNNNVIFETYGINIITYDFDSCNKGPKQFINLLILFSKLFKKYNFKVIHSYRLFPNLLNVLVNIFNKQKVITHITGLGIAFSNPSLYFKIIKYISFIFYQFIIFRSDTIIVQNENDKKQLNILRCWDKKIQVIYGSGINTDLFNPDLYNKNKLRITNNINLTHLVFICVTRLIWEKGVKELVDSFHDYNNTNPNSSLLIVGSPDSSNPRHVPLIYIKQYNNKSNILFLGEKDNIQELLALSDIFVYPSYYREGIPRAILEALSMGLPIITTEMPGCILTVEQEKNGLIVKPRSSFELYKSFVKIEKLDFNEMSYFSRNIYRNKFSEKIIFDKIEKTYI